MFKFYLLSSMKYPIQESGKKVKWSKWSAEFQHPCRDRNDSHTLIQCTADSIHCSACVVIYIFHICTRDHAYSDRLQT